jgi:RluA family pseudouridine synthase
MHLLFYGNLLTVAVLEFSKITLLFMNKDFVAVDKPTGLSVHNNEDPENLLLFLEKQLHTKNLYPVHRLDKETSGVQIIALQQQSAKELSTLFQEKSVKKTYLGIVRGKLNESQGRWTQSLTDKAEGRKSPAGILGLRVACQTEFRVLKTNPFFSLCQFDLQTGRQHQIRKHCALANHPLVGDNRYGESKYNRKIEGIYKTARMFLHCSELHFLNHKIMSPTPSEFNQITGG